MTAKIEDMKAAVAARKKDLGHIKDEPPAKYIPTSADIMKAAEDGQQGIAQLFAKLNKNKFLYDHAANQWFEWCGHAWGRDGIGEPLAALDEVSNLFRDEYDNLSQQIAEIAVAMATLQADAIGDKDKDAVKAKAKKLEDQQKEVKSKQGVLLKAITSLQFIHFRKQVVEFSAQGRGSLGFDGNSWDSRPMLLACKNGVLDLSSGEFRPGRQKDYLKTSCPTEYDPAARPDAWEAFVLSVFDGNADLAGYVQRLLGYAITGKNCEHILPVFWGQGRNGKGTMLETLAAVLGDFVGPVQAEMLLDQGKSRSSAGPSPDIMALRGRRLAWASETKEGRRMDSGKVKWLVGGDTLVGRPPYGRFEVRFQPTHTLILMTNNKPHAPADDFALWQRIHLIPFDLSFVDNPKHPNERKRDRTLCDRLRREPSGILNWLIAGALQWQKEGLNPPAEVREATAAYQNEEDTLGAFVTDCCCIGAQFCVKGKQLYDAYAGWCKDNQIPPMSGTMFGRKMSDRYEKKVVQTVTYYGIGLLTTSWQNG